MKVLARFFSIPIGILVGCALWLIVYLQIFDSIQLLPISGLIYKLFPGLLVGAFLGYRYPGVFLWFMDLEGGAEVSDIEVSSPNSEVEFESKEGSKKK